MVNGGDLLEGDSAIACLSKKRADDEQDMVQALGNDVGEPHLDVPRKG